MYGLLVLVFNHNDLYDATVNQWNNTHIKLVRIDTTNLLAQASIFSSLQLVLVVILVFHLAQNSFVSSDLTIYQIIIIILVLCKYRK